MKMASTYAYRLIKEVCDRSVSNVWDTAVDEWEIADCVEDESCSSRCICGKENIKYLFTLRNNKNRNELYPIGSSCIKKFGRTELNGEAAIQEKMFKLYHAVENGTFVTMSPEFFSRKLIKRLYIEGAFDCAYNHYNGENDYRFFLEMFNKKDKNNISPGKEKKIKAIIVGSILPHLRHQLRNKKVELRQAPQQNQ